MHECINYKKIDEEILECRTCSHFCKVNQGKTGICGIRQNIDSKLYLIPYGRAVAANIDPVEKKPIFHFLPGSLAYSVGTFGCNFRCDNCQNFDISQISEVKGKVEAYENLQWGINLPPERIVDEALKKKCQSVAYTYNEPTVWMEYALDTMKIAKSKGLKNIWVSNGFMSNDTLDAIIPYLDAINVDIKSYDDKFYRFNCGGSLAPVLENCIRLIKEKVWVEITTLIIPSFSDDKNMLRGIAQFIYRELGEHVPWHVSAFSGKISWKFKDLPDTSMEMIDKAYYVGLEEGLKYVYAGNVSNVKMESTNCPNCGKIVIERSGYQIKRYDKNGKCKCGQKIHGIF